MCLKWWFWNFCKAVELFLLNKAYMESTTVESLGILLCSSSIPGLGPEALNPMLGIWPLSGQFISLGPTDIWGWVIPCALRVGLCSLGASNTPPDPLPNCDNKRLLWTFSWKAEWPQLRTTSLSRGRKLQSLYAGRGLVRKLYLAADRW